MSTVTGQAKPSCPSSPPVPGASPTRPGWLPLLSLVVLVALLLPLPARAAEAVAGGDAVERLLSWATQRLGPLPEGLGDRGGRVGREVAASLATPARVVTATALHEAALWGGSGLLLAMLAGRWVRARAVFGCLWLLVAVPCVALGAAYLGMWRGGAGSLATAVDEGLLVERLAVTAALAASSTAGTPLATGAEELARQLAAAHGEMRGTVRQASSGLGQLAGEQSGLAGALVAPRRLEAVLAVLEEGSAPTPGMLVALAAGPAALAQLPDSELAAARALIARTAPLRQQTLAAIRATAWPNLLAGGAMAALPLLVAMTVGLVVRLKGAGRRQRTATAISDP